VQFTAQGTFSDGTKRDLTTLVTWTATAPVATISSGGLAKTYTQGSSIITAAFNTPGGLISGTATLTVTAPTLVSISVQPAVTSVVVGNTVQFTAQGTFADGTTQDLTTLVTWTATRPVATISPAGLATAYTPGSSVITAAFNTPGGVISGTATLTVTATPTLVSISVQPAVTTVAAGNTAQFTAQGTYSDGTKQDLTNLVTWTATAPVATISAGGLAKTYIPGSTVITAAFNTPGGLISGTATLTVTGPALVSIVVTGETFGTAKIAMGTTYQFFANGIYSDGGEHILTNPVWSVTPNPNSIASIKNTGIATGLSAGTVTVNATDSATSISGSATLNVTAATLTHIVVSPVGQTIAPSTQLLFAALGEFSDKTTQNVIRDVKWSSTVPAVATISTVGIATGVAVGSTMIQASHGSVTGTAPLTISTASLLSIALTPASAGMAIGSFLRVEAVGTFSDGTKQVINRESAWTVIPSNGSIATVDRFGDVTAVAAGSAMVKAQLGAVSQTVVLTVQSVTSVAITPNPATIAQGTAQQFKATATLADGTTQDVTYSATWVSATPTITTISNSLPVGGRATGIAPGTATIGASIDGQSATALLTVTTATMTSLAITPKAPADVALGGTQQYTATGRFSDSTTQDLTNQVTWSSSEPGVAVVDGFGAASITGFGTATVKASDSINGRAATGQNVLTVH
jgi:trimeric autotransporter adhesin